MSKCKFCGEKAGLFKDKHDECEKKFIDGQNAIISCAQDAVFTNSDLNDVKTTVESIASNSLIDDYQPLILKGLEFAIENRISESPLYQKEDDELDKFVEFFKIDKDKLNDNQWWFRAVEGLVIGDLLENKIPARASIVGELPILFQEDEKIIWLFQGVKYHKVQSKSKRVGKFSGYSGRILPSLYYKWGSFASESISSLEIKHVDQGYLAITDKQIYFYGNVTGFKLPYGKMLAIEPFSDGVKIQKTHSNAYPIYFETNNGWFTYNLLLNLYQMAATNS